MGEMADDLMDRMEWQQMEYEGSYYEAQELSDDEVVDALLEAIEEEQEFCYALDTASIKSICVTFKCTDRISDKQRNCLNIAYTEI